ncbi:unnamed protein product [Moneuplotes crassus]|uniref:Uncharacterized protein n=1 Tax=Euplotes crassus TaxID=5936 RepID=A0AAD2CYZ3_EUPCR|nr:unnamed protein product [Moneuplotes crassus]
MIQSIFVHNQSNAVSLFNNDIPFFFSTGSSEINVDNSLFNMDVMHVPVMGGWKQISVSNSEVPQEMEPKRTSCLAKSPSTRKTALCDRDDVINKSLLRLIRKFFSSNYKEEYSYIRFINKDKRNLYYYCTSFLFVYKLLKNIQGCCAERQIKDCLRRMKAHGYQYFNNEFLRKSGIEVDEETREMIRILCYLINHKSMARAEKILGVTINPEVYEFTHLFKNSCSAYTHNLFNELCNNDYFIRIFRFFYTSFQTYKCDKEDTSLADRIIKRREKARICTDENIFVNNLKKFKPAKANLSKYLTKINSLAQVFGHHN